MMEKDLLDRLRKLHAKIEGPLSYSFDRSGGYVKDARGEFPTGLLPDGKPDVYMAEFICAAWKYLPQLLDEAENMSR